MPANPQQQSVDLLRETPLRLLGYSNEVGEAFRHVAPRFVGPSYAVAMVYCLADTVDKGKQANDRWAASPTQHKRVGFAAVDTMLWQTLASVAIPGLVINRVVWATRNFTSGLAMKPKSIPVRWGPTALGLFVVPFIVHPIDDGVHWALDRSTRPALESLLGLEPV